MKYSISKKSGQESRDWDISLLSIRQLSRLYLRENSLCKNSSRGGRWRVHSSIRNGSGKGNTMSSKKLSLISDQWNLGQILECLCITLYLSLFMFSSIKNYLIK